MSDLAVYTPNELAAIARIEIDSAIATAKRYPRSFTKFMEDAKNIVASSQKIAASCIYALPQKEWDKEKKISVEKIIEGPSVRLAEIAFGCYGNLKAATRLKGRDQKTITVEGIVIDLEKNNTYSAEQVRSIVKSNNEIYSDSMQVKTMNAASSIVFRNAIFKHIPRSAIDEIYELAIKTAVGEEKDLPERRKKCLDAFADIGIPEDKVLKLVKRKKIEDINLNDLRVLIGIYNAKKDGLLDSDDEQPKNEAAKNLNDKLKNNKEDSVDPEFFGEDK
jgi:hypothetical protein